MTTHSKSQYKIKSAKTQAEPSITGGLTLCLLIPAPLEQRSLSQMPRDSGQLLGMNEAGW